jgi:predicted RNA binding protein YcfA (HicA-like mRNA interferase family)
VLRGSSDTNIRFSEIRALLSRLGFAERIKGSHHILQPRKSLAKPYQVKQVRKVPGRNKLAEGAE